MKIAPGLMKAYCAEKITVKRETRYPIPPEAWEPYEAYVISVEGQRRIMRNIVDINLCNVAQLSGPSLGDPVMFAVLEALQNFREYIANSERT